MYDDPVVAEIRQYRLEHAAKYDYDIDKICDALLKKQKEVGRKLVSRGPKLLKQKTGS